MSITTIITALAAIELAIVPPSGQKAIANAFDEFTGIITQFPCFVNIEQDAEVSVGPAYRETRRDIWAHLILAPADQKYDIRLRRLWEAAVVDALCANQRISSTVDNIIGPIRINYAPLHLSGGEYITVTFEIPMIYHDAPTLAA